MNLFFEYIIKNNSRWKNVNLLLMMRHYFKQFKQLINYKVILGGRWTVDKILLNN